MRVSCFLLITSLTLLGMTEHAAAQQHTKRNFKPFLTRGTTTLTVNAGIRRNNFDWNIAADDSGTATPNVLSELTWTDISILEFKPKIRHIEPADIYFIKGGIQMEAELIGGLTISGDNQDSDWLGNNRTLEFSRSNNDASDGYALGASVSIGYQFHLQDPTSPTYTRPLPQKSYVRALPSGRILTSYDRTPRRISQRKSPSTTAINITPLIGYGWDQQTYKMTNANQTISDFGFTNPLGPFDGLDSEYTAQWQEPFIGLEAEIKGEKNQFNLRGQYHDLDYSAEAVWNLRDNFQQDPSYTHEADGTGYLLNAAYAYALDSRYAVTLDASYQKRTAEDGLDKVFLTNGQTPTTRLNEVNDESQALHLGLRYHW